MFAQNLLDKKADRPKVLGAVKNSPAYVQGVKPGDIIKKINGQPIDSIEEAWKALLHHLYHNARLEIARNNAVFELNLVDFSKDRYPYSSQGLRRFAPFGLLLPERYFSQNEVKDIAYYISLHRARNVLVFTSTQARPLIQQLLKKYNISKTTGSTISLVAPKNIFFGGNIDSGNLLVIDDFIAAIGQYIKKEIKPDLIIVPASPFTAWQRDLTGRLNSEIERRFNLPVEFIETSPPLLGDEIKKILRRVYEKKQKP